LSTSPECSEARVVSGPVVENDRMAIMAAVAMTQLLGGGKSPRRVSDASKSGYNAGDPATTASGAGSNSSNSSASNTKILAETTTTIDDKGEYHNSKRKPQQEYIVAAASSAEEDRYHYSKRPRTEQDSEYDYRSSPPAHPRLESRNPSPVSTTSASMHPSMSYEYDYHHGAPPHSHSHHRHHHHHHPHHSTPPPRPHYSHHYEYEYDYSQQNSRYAPTPQKTPPPQQLLIGSSPTYEDVIKSSGLPKALSFRKICSKCGKTRGEHGELGFGNKCVYQDCGKCGAGVQMHLKAKSPMGILCRLTVEEGATPGYSAGYERKIRDLAARADLQKTLLKDRQERAERMAQTFP
jgi:hypothetical protein